MPKNHVNLCKSCQIKSQRLVLNPWQIPTPSIIIRPDHLQNSHYHLMCLRWFHFKSTPNWFSPYPLNFRLPKLVNRARQLEHLEGGYCRSEKAFSTSIGQQIVQYFSELFDTEKHAIFLTFSYVYASLTRKQNALIQDFKIYFNSIPNEKDCLFCAPGGIGVYFL